MTAAQAKPDRRRLAHLLRAARSALDPDGFIELVAGVLAFCNTADCRKFSFTPLLVLDIFGCHSFQPRGLR